jgi:hypothetical protein
MFTKSTTPSLLLALTPLFPHCLAEPNPFDSQVFYLTNYLTSDTQTPYRESQHLRRDSILRRAGSRPLLRHFSR